jgi:pyridoxamine 5'-phosphate oxidase
VSRPDDPIQRFREVYARASADAPFDPAAVVLATATRDGRPSARVVLLRRVDESGFAFYTNYESRKGRELRENPQAALCCYWPWLDEQVRIEGPVTVAPAADSDEYFASRPRGSQIGAWVSKQSMPLAGRADLETAYEALERETDGHEVPRPPFWGGYRLRPERLEFWRAGRFRLHDRLLYVREGDGWRTEALYP